jgi:hypothetical protein
MFWTYLETNMLNIRHAKMFEQKLQREKLNVFYVHHILSASLKVFKTIKQIKWYAHITKFL